MMKQFVLQFCFFYVLPRRTDIMTKDLIFLMNVLPDVYICSHWKKSAPLLPEGTVKCIYIYSSIANSQRMQTEINKSGTVAKKGFKSKIILSNIKVI